MSKAGDSKIKDFFGDDYTKITFKPDLSKFKMEKLDDDIVAIFRRRAYDIAAASRSVKVMLNGKRVPVRTYHLPNPSSKSMHFKLLKMLLNV